MHIGLIGQQRRRRIMFIVCDSSLEMKLRQERHGEEHVAPDGAYLLFYR
jgi:hypothetical protein